MPTPPAHDIPSSPPQLNKELPSPPAFTRVKSPSFSLHSRSDDNSSGNGRFSQKVKDLFKEKRPSAPPSPALTINTLDKSPVARPFEPIQRVPSTLSFKLDAQPETLSYILTGDTKSLPPDFKEDGFKEAVNAAQKACDRLATASLWLSTAAGILEGGGGWLPLVGQAAKAVTTMLNSAQQIAVAKVAALRLVERCACVLEAIIESLRRNDGKLSDTMRADVDRLIIRIHATAELLSKLADRPFFKLWLHSNEVFDQIQEVNNDLRTFFDIFHVETILTGNALLEQIRRDRETDMKILRDLLEAGVRDENIMLGMLVRKTEEQQEATKTLQRALDALVASHGLVVSPVSPESHTIPHPLPSRSPKSPEDPRRVFLEKALDVLRRHSAASDYGVPDWTITSLEVYYEKRITTSFFSEVWRGRWQGELVAIKDLNSVVNRDLFIQEVEVWRRLKSRHILPFLGASSTTGPPPWFLVSPYLKNGNIINYLDSQSEHTDRLALAHQIAQGLAYLHSRDIIHGDFKATNVLITDIGDAVICDFGMSQLKLDVSTKSNHGNTTSGTLRWQAPERLQGGNVAYATDVYAFAITLCEMYLPNIPYGYVDDEVVRNIVLAGGRPARPPGMPTSLWELVDKCWAQDPAARPSFDFIAAQLGKMYQKPKRSQTRECKKSALTWKTPLQAAHTPLLPRDITRSNSKFAAALLISAISPLHSSLLDSLCSSSSGSVLSIPPHLEKELSFESDRAERHYRHYLQHDFDDRLTIPLWFPSIIPLGSVGYVRHGEFVKLLDATRPPIEAHLPPMPVMDEFGALQTYSTPVATRNAAERGWDLFNSVASFIKSSGETSQKTISRQLAFPLKPGMKQASLVVDEGEFSVFKSFSEARAYLTTNIEWILDTYGDRHHLAREDIIFVVGTLKARNWAMIVSNFAPRTTLTFNVHAEASRNAGEPWGTWAVNRAPRPDSGKDAVYTGSNDPKYNCKVSNVSTSMDTVLLAKLRFTPGSDEPTLYP